MEEFYCGDIVEPGTHIDLADVVHYFNIVNGDVESSELSEVQQRLLNILNSDEFSEVDFENLDDLYSVLVGTRSATICSDKPIACCDQKNRLQTHGDMEDYPSYRGLSVQAFEDGGFVCYDDLELDGLSNPFGVLVNKADGTKVYGKLKATGKFRNNEIVYYSPNGEFYTGKLISQNGFENELDYAGECAIDGIDIVSESSPTPTPQNKMKCENHECNLRLIHGEGDMLLNNSYSMLGNGDKPTEFTNGASQIQILENSNLIASTVIGDFYTNWISVFFPTKYKLDSAIDSFCLTLKINASATENARVGFAVKQNDTFYIYNLASGTNFSDFNLEELEIRNSMLSKLYGGPEVVDFVENSEFEFGMVFMSTTTSTITASKIDMCIGGNFSLIS